MTRKLMALVGPLIALAAAPAAHAGPVPTWTYRTVIETAPGQTELYLGRFGINDPDQTRTVYAWAGLPAGRSGGMTGDGTITLADVSKGGYRLTDAAPGADAVTVDGFRMLLEITDGRTGLRGHMAIPGRGTLVTSMPDSVASEVQLTGGGSAAMLLNGTRYEYTWRTAESESVSRLVADVRVTAADAPEPATLALAGLGLGVVGVRRLRRRTI